MKPRIKDPEDIERQLAEHEAAIEKLRRDLTPPTAEQRHPFPNGTFAPPSPYSTELAATQDRARRQRVVEQRLRAEAEAAAYEADAPRRAKVEAELAENAKSIEAARAELNRLEWENGKLRRSL